MNEIVVSHVIMGEPAGAGNTTQALTTTLQRNVMAEPIQDLPGEIWKPVVGHEGRYEVSDFGRIRSLARRVRSRYGADRTIRGQFMRPHRLRSGYDTVNLSVAGVKKRRFVHRLVLEAFVGPCPEGMQCCHNDGNPLNNRLDNLRWDTVSANNLDKNDHGTQRRGSRHHYASINEFKVLRIRELRAKHQQSNIEIARAVGCSASVVYNVLRGKTWTHI